jgi:hypothetical protein
MRKTSAPSLSRKKAAPSKLIMGLMVAAVSVLVGTASIANAAPGQGQGNGYGGGINIDLSQFMGDNNVIVIIINYFAGGGQ